MISAPFPVSGKTKLTIIEETDAEAFTRRFNELVEEGWTDRSFGHSYWQDGKYRASMFLVEKIDPDPSQAFPSEFHQGSFDAGLQNMKPFIDLMRKLGQRCFEFNDSDGTLDESIDDAIEICRRFKEERPDYFRIFHVMLLATKTTEDIGVSFASQLKIYTPQLRVMDQAGIEDWVQALRFKVERKIPQDFDGPMPFGGGL